VRDLVDWGIEGGHTTEEQLRLTVSARAEKAKVLIKPVEEGGSGLSRRQAAKVLGVNEGTVRNDLRNNSADNAEKIRAAADSVGDREMENENPFARKTHSSRKRLPRFLELSSRQSFSTRHGQ
jgi:hypothetical protein